jgi:hypothetical protein
MQAGLVMSAARAMQGSVTKVHAQQTWSQAAAGERQSRSVQSGESRSRKIESAAAEALKSGAGTGGALSIFTIRPG